MSNELTTPVRGQNVSLRAATAEDDLFLYEIFVSTREDEFRFLEETQKQALLKMQYNAQRSQYDEGYPDAESNIVLADDRPVGRLLVDEGEREILLIDIALLPESRTLGIGTHLLNELLRRAADARKPVRLHVLNSNPALRLYQRLGFSQVGGDSMYLEMMFEPRGK